MLRFLLSRLGQATAVMLLVALAAFAMLRFVGDPVNNLLGQEATLEERAELREELGLNDPVPMQFLRFLGGAVRGDFGVSYRLQQPVSEVLARRAPATLELVFVSAVLALLVGIPLGVYTGIRPEGPVARIILSLSLIGVSLPTFVIGMVLIYIFSVSLGWLPSYGRGGVVEIAGWPTGLLTLEGWRSILLPAITLSLFQMTLILRLIRGEMMEVLRSDFIRFARARGIPTRSLYLRHALKNTLVPVITVIGLNIGGLIGFSIVTETVFQWPGLGALFVQAVEFVDVPLMAAYLVMVALVFVGINLVTDLLYRAIDPRLRPVK